MEDNEPEVVQELGYLNQGFRKESIIYGSAG